MGNTNAGERRTVNYTEEEREALRANRIVRLPCYENPFADFGKRKVALPNIRGEDDVDDEEGKIKDVAEKAEEPKEADQEKEKESEGEENKDEKQIPERWKHIVEVLSREITNPEELCKALEDIHPGQRPLFFEYYFKNPKNINYRTFFGDTLPKVQKLALRLPELFPEDKPLPLLLPNVEAEVTLTQEQIACLMSNAFFCTICETDTTSVYNFNSFSFEILYANARGPCASTVVCILHYLNQVTEQMPDGIVTFRRQVLTESHVPDFASSTKKIGEVKVFAQGRIEDCDAPLHADFANEYIGGGVLHGGCVQEEILFAVKTECLVSMLFCAKMEPNEVIFITGAERFSDYSGYGHSFTWGGPHEDQTPRDEHKRRTTTIVAMDAVMSNNFSSRAFVRDLMKAYCAFWVKDPEAAPEIRPGPIATGNWGCGAFGGDKSVKFFQQLLAASEAGRELWWYTFNESYKSPEMKLEAWINAALRIIKEKDMTVGDVYRILIDGIKQDTTGDNLFTYFAAAVKRLPVAPATPATAAEAALSPEEQKSDQPPKTDEQS